MASQIEIAALGRPFTLGMLYDAWSDQLLTAFALWDKTTTDSMTTVSPHHSQDSKVLADDSSESKSSSLDISASLNASFLGGLVEVGGSARYLKDTKKSKNQSRVTWQYKATTIFKQLATTVEPQYPDVMKKGNATHVVTGILYGANAFFVFDSEKVEGSSLQNVEAGMRAVLNKVPSVSVEGKVDVKWNEEEKALTERFTCKFYGDLHLPGNPRTFEEAVKTYGELTTQLEKGQGVPMKVWLTPLSNFSKEAPGMIREISAGLVVKAQDTLDDLAEVRARCSDCLDDNVIKSFPEMKKKLEDFQTRCDHYVSSLRGKLAKKVPAIRRGEEDEGSAKKLFKDRQQSPFSDEKLNKWLVHKEKEMNIIKSCVDTMKGTKIIFTQSDLDREVLAPGVEDALCYVFTSLEDEDPYINAMTSYLDSLQSDSDHRDDCYYFTDVVDQMREKAEGFSCLAKAMRNTGVGFLVAAIRNDKYKGATIYRYKNRKLVTQDFSKPQIRDVEKLTDKRDLIWYATDLTLDPDTANNYVSLSEGNKKATCGNWQYGLPDLQDRFNEKCQVLCKEGLKRRHYWEVEWSDSYRESVYVAVTYSNIERKGSSNNVCLGRNSVSWCIGQQTDYGTMMAVHNNTETPWGFSPGSIRRVGVYLDWPAGTLSFYSVSFNTLTHLHTYRTKFTRALYPGFSVQFTGNYIHLLPFEPMA